MPLVMTAVEYLSFSYSQNQISHCANPVGLQTQARSLTLTVRVSKALIRS